MINVWLLIDHVPGFVYRLEGMLQVPCYIIHESTPFKMRLMPALPSSAD